MHVLVQMVEADGVDMESFKQVESIKQGYVTETVCRSQPRIE